VVVNLVRVVQRGNGGGDKADAQLPRHDTVSPKKKTNRNVFSRHDKLNAFVVARMSLASM
jgi:hypothetical protein